MDFSSDEEVEFEMDVEQDFDKDVLISENNQINDHLVKFRDFFTSLIKILNLVQLVNLKQTCRFFYHLINVEEFLKEKLGLNLTTLNKYSDLMETGSHNPFYFIGEYHEYIHDIPYDVRGEDSYDIRHPDAKWLYAQRDDEYYSNNYFNVSESFNCVYICELKGCIGWSTFLILAEMKNGEYFYMSAGCDMTGFDCRGEINVYFSLTLLNIFKWQMTELDRQIVLNSIK
jgi:hypothetical protein